MRPRRLGTLTAALATLAALTLPATAVAAAQTTTAAPTSPAAPAATQATRPVLAVDGTVADPARYTLAQLSALPSETVTLPLGGRPVQASGVSLDSLVTLAAPVLPSVKNALLRVLVTASGPLGHPVTFALGELDPNFGDHDAVVVLSVNGRTLPGGPALVVPGDRPALRDLLAVRQITVGVTNPAVVTPPSPGALVVEQGSRNTVLSAATLAALPAETRTVTFTAGDGQETHVETGPTLDAVLRAAHVRTSLTTWVAAVGSDGYVATVTPAEAWAGGRPLLISLTEDGTALAAPRLVTDGDVKGGRYDSGLDDLVVGQGSPSS